MDRRTFLMLAGAGTAIGATSLVGAKAALGAELKENGIRYGVGARAAGLQSQETATVPLQIIDIGGGQLKVGIQIRLGGGAPRLYTFDTGSSGFYASRNPAWWPSFRPTGGPQISQSYGSDETFQSIPVSTAIGIPTDSGEIQVETRVGQILYASGGSLGSLSTSPWRRDVAAGRPPLFGHFYGDFGSGLKEKNGLFAVLPQLPGNLSSGFAVRLGCQGSPSSTPTLQIGLTDAIRSEVTSWIPMNGGPQTPPFPLSGRPTYAQDLVAGDFFLSGTSDYPFSATAILDTGGPTTTLHEHGTELKVPDALLTANRRRVLSDVIYRVSAAGTGPANGLDLEFFTGDIAGTNLVTITQTDGKGFVNLGLIPFFRYTVVFDLERGLVGFGPCS